MASACTVCKLTMNSTFQYQQHLAGKQHAKKLRLQTEGNNPVKPGIPGTGKKAKKKGQAPINFVRASVPQNNAAGQQPAVDPSQVYINAAGMQPSDPSQYYGNTGDPSQLYNNTADPSQFYNNTADPSQFYSTAGIQPSDPSQLYSAEVSQFYTAKKRKAGSGQASDPSVAGDGTGVATAEWTSFDSLFCTICAARLPGKEQAELHYRGQKHMKKAKIARLRELGALEGYVDVNQVENNTASSAQKGGYFYCSFCNITVNSDDQLRIHLAGSRHKKMMEMRKRHMEVLEAVGAVKKPALEAMPVMSGDVVQ